VRRDWVPLLSSALLDQRKATRTRRRRLKPLMQKLEDHIRANGPVGPAEFESRRVVGGFNTIKATTRALRARSAPASCAGSCWGALASPGR